nr:MAG: RNA-dependent RNA polymerase [Wenzhou bat picorna-like virus 4]
MQNLRNTEYTPLSENLAARADNTSSNQQTPAIPATAPQPGLSVGHDIGWFTDDAAWSRHIGVTTKCSSSPDRRGHAFPAEIPSSDHCTTPAVTPECPKNIQSETNPFDTLIEEIDHLESDSEGYEYDEMPVLPPLNWRDEDTACDPYFTIRWDREVESRLKQALQDTNNCVLVPQPIQQTEEQQPDNSWQETKTKLVEALTNHALPINLIVNMAIRVHEAESYMEKVSAVFGLCEALRHYQPQAIKSVIEFLESLFTFDVKQQSTSESLVGFILIVLAFMSLNVKGVASVQWINDEIMSLGATARGFNSIAQTITTHAESIGTIVLNALGLSKPTPVSQMVEDCVKRIDEHAERVEEFLSQLNNDTSVVLVQPWKADTLISKSEAILKESVLLATHKEYTALGPNIPRLQAAVKLLKTTRDRVVNASATRVEPVVIQLYGEPGVGKSFFVKAIVNALSKALHIPPEIYARGLTKHWDSFVGQYFVVYDDFLSDLQGEDMKELIHIVSSNPFVVPMANVEQKGLRFASPFIILCSNSRDAPLNNGQISNPDAIDRRRHFLVEVKRKAGFEKLDKYHDGASHLELTLLNPLFREGRPGQRDTRTPINFDTLINSVIHRYKQHLDVFEKRRADEQSIRDNYLSSGMQAEPVQQSTTEVSLPRAIVKAEAKTIALFGPPGVGKSTFARSIPDVCDFRLNPSPSTENVLLIDDPRTPEEIQAADKYIREHFDKPLWKNILLIANPDHLKQQLLAHYGGAADAFVAFRRRIHAYAVKKTGFLQRTLTYTDMEAKKKITKAEIFDHICEQPAKLLVTYAMPRKVTCTQPIVTRLTFNATWKTLWGCSNLTDLYSALGVSCLRIAPHIPLLRRVMTAIKSDANVDREMTPEAWARYFNANMIREVIPSVTQLTFSDVVFTFFNYKDERDTLQPLLLVAVETITPEKRAIVQTSEITMPFQQLKDTLKALPTSFAIDGELLQKYSNYIIGIAGTLLAMGALGYYVYRQGYKNAIQEAAFTNSDGINTRFTAKRRMVLTDEEADFLEIAAQLPQNKGKTLREILDTFQEKVTSGYDHYERKVYVPLEESQEPIRKNVSRTHIESQEPKRAVKHRTHIESQEPPRKHMPRTCVESQEPSRKNQARTQIESQEPQRPKNNTRTHVEAGTPLHDYCKANPVANDKERAILVNGTEFETKVTQCSCVRCGTKYCQKTCTICAPLPEACIDVGGLDVSRLVARSIVDLYRKDGSRINNGVMLAGHVGVTTAHGVRDNEDLVVNHFGTTYTATVIAAKRRRDLAFFRLERTAPPFRSLVHLLPDTVQADREVGAIVVVPQHDKLNMMMNYPVMVSAQTTYCIKGNEIEARSYNKSVSQAAFDNQFTVAGDCGSPIIAIDTAETRKFLGIHSASSPMRAYMAYLSRREVASILETPSFEAAADVLRYQRITPLEEPMTWGEHMELVGTALKVPCPDKTKLWITPYAGFHEIRYQPAILSDRDPRKTIERSVIDCLLTKWDHAPVRIPKPEYMERAVHALYNHYAKIFVKKNIKLTTLTASEALNSWKGNAMSNPIYLASSAGYPWACLKFPGVQASGKFGFVEFDQKEQRYRFADNPAGRALVDSVATLNGVLKAGKNVEIPFQLHLKDECLKENKIATVGTRSICASPLDFLIVARQYLHAAHAAISSTSDHGPCMVGVNPSSLDWHTLAMRMLQKGPIGFDGDYSAFDSRVPAQMFDYLAQVYEMLYEEFDANYQLEHATVRRGIFRCLQNPLLVARGNVYRSKRGGQPSGQPATSIDNSLINTLYFLYAWQVVHEDNPAMQSPERFFEHCALAVYGDDNICTMTEAARIRFTPTAVQNVLNEHLGQKVSDAAKTGVMKWTRLEDMEFLKRTFHKIGSYYTGALVPQSFEKILSHANYQAHHYNTDDVCTSPQILAQLVDTALREASLHGEEFYNQLRCYITKINAANHLEPPTRESWFSMFNSVYHSAKVPSQVELVEEESGPGGTHL